MIEENKMFLTFGKNKKNIDKYVKGGSNNHLLPTEWINITDEHSEDIMTKFDVDEIYKIDLEILGKEFSDIYGKKIIFVKKSSFPSLDDGDIFIVHSSGVFSDLFRFKINYVYKNYDLVDPSNGLLTKDTTSLDTIYASFLKKKMINFKAMRLGNETFALQQYDIYQKEIKNYTGSQSSFKKYLVDNFSSFFDFWDDFDKFSLNFNDFCIYTSVEPFLPDFYFTTKGDLVFIHHPNIFTMMEKIKVFIEYLNSVNDDTFVYVYNYD